MPSASWKLVWEDAKAGNFQKVLCFLRKAEDVPTEHKLYLMNILHINFQNNSIDEDLISIHKELEFPTLSEIQLKRYLSYMQIILRNLFTEENEKYILEMPNIFLPECLTTNGDLPIYNNTIKLFFYHIQKKKSVQNRDLTLKLLIFLTKMCSYCSDNELMRYFKGTFQHLSSEFNISEMGEFYKKFLKLFGKNENNFNDIMEVLKLIFKNYVKKADVKELRQLISLTPKYLKSSELIVLTNMFSAMAKISGPIQDDTKDFQKNLFACMDSFRVCYEYSELKDSAITMTGFLTHSVFKSEFLEKLNISDEILIIYLNFAQLININIDKIFKGVDYKCCSKINMDVDMHILLLLNVEFIFKLLDFKRDSYKTLPTKIWEELYVLLKMFGKNLDLMISNKCDNLKKYWSYFGILIYNLSIVLYKDGVLENIKFIKIFMNYVLKIEGRNDHLVTNNAGIYVCNMYSSILFKSGLYIEAAIILALGFYLYPHKNSEYQLDKWIECISHSKSRITFVKVLNSNVKAIKCLDETFERISDKKILLNLYFRELGCYLQNEQYEDAEFILDTIVKLKPCPLMAENLVGLGFKMVLNFPIKHRGLIKEVLNHHTTDKIIMGYLTYIEYRYKLSEIIVKNKADMDKSVIIKKDLPIIEPKDDDDECDVVSNYYNLEIKNHKELIQILIDSLDYFKVGNISSNDKIYETLVELGHDFYMNCFLDEAATVFDLALKVAKVIKNDQHIFKALAHLIGCIDDSFDIKELKILAESLIKKEVPDKTFKTYYYVNLCTFYLNSGEINKALALYNNFKDTQMKDDSYTFTRAIVHAKLLLLQAKICNLPCSYEVDKHTDFALILPEKAYKLAVGIRKSYEEHTQTNWIVSTILDITEYILSLNIWMYLPRQVRSYGKESLILAQKLVLPFRTTRLLIYLTRADLITCNFNDSIVKLEGLTEILGLRNSYVKTSKAANDIQIIITDLQEMSLDNISHPRALNMRSPMLYTESFKMPSFINHPSDCKCFFCKNIEYQKLILQKILIDALYTSSQKNYDVTENYYSTLLLIQRKFNKSTLFNNIFNEILLNYAKYSLLIDNKEKCKFLVKELITNINSHAAINHYLYDEAVNLNSTLSSNFQIPILKNTKKSKWVNRKQQPLPIIKTPENKISTVQINKTPVSVYSEKPERRRRVRKVTINFDHSPDMKSSGDSQGKENEWKLKIKPLPEAAKSIKKDKKPSVTKSEDIFCTPLSKVEEINPRTKMLTERLKSSKKLKSTENLIKEKPKVRKNLSAAMRDLDGDKEENKPVRRTRRNI